jgi:hypothetical protein
VEEEVVAVVGEVVVAAEEDLVHLSQLRRVDIGKRPITQRLATAAGQIVSIRPSCSLIVFLITVDYSKIQ